MSTYAVSDIHGEYEQYMDLLRKIRFSEEDTLYVLGDMVDRGPEPMKVVLDMMSRPNVIPIAGNHEMMALDCLRFLMKDITEETVGNLDKTMLGKLLNWQANGSETTIKTFRALPGAVRREVLDYLGSCSLYEEVCVGEREFLLVHAGLGNFAPEKEPDDYEIDELIWTHFDYDRSYFPDKTIITGHIPTQLLANCSRKGYIYHSHNNIDLDCGACFGGRLGALCLETMEEFYSR